MPSTLFRFASVDKIVQDSARVGCLAELPSVHWLSAGYVDWRLGTDKVLVELNESVDDTLEQLSTSLSLMTQLLDVLSVAGLIDPAR